MTDTTTHKQQGAHGGEVFRIARETGTALNDIADFSSNANSLCRDITEEILFSNMQGAYSDYNHYPDTWSSELAAAIAAHESVSQQEIVVGHGSTETIFLTFQQIRPKRVLLVGPMFSEYAKACSVFAEEYDLLTCSSGTCFVPNSADFANSEKYDLVVLCSPNNPATITYPNMREIIQAIQSPYMLIDSTYREFMHGTPEYDATRTTQYREWCNQNTSIITMHSFTKFFYCTGVRLGYALSDPDTVSKLKQGKMPWTVTASAQKSGLNFLLNIERYRSRLPQMRTYRAMFTEEVRSTNVFAEDCIFSGVNFLFCKLKNPEHGAQFYEFLLTKSILVRLCDNIPGTERGFIRMQVKTPEEWETLITALHDWAASLNVSTR
ncbi:aminotransferase class I/II-fold pyridoxal phosphate-dependent enzyme [Halodesulfovibrio sp. MK-HDV]|jgi:threonine-phosphate decarboxylase|uniref:aminotransferase class I/II-fold pyridoxal phosphate-dependent enzyme n=1 Tax=Halodesulfovibrio sp. MK-HDV TaxID=2599925 RepID=UPI0013703BCB|nr:aminotransferase class I/II-fold pyridoxal phosphate-dependent enzyme [Halodesulfovibrio sp. MK-HDV]KAF1074329.1 Threonine-phosphate decarboxylase [Halodesulfovibrio sp. MK-HDV]